MKQTLLLLGINLILFCTINVNAQWQKFSGTNGKNVSGITKLDNHLFIALNPGFVNMSADNGSTWTETRNGLSAQNVFSITAAGANLVCGTIFGVFTSTNNGSNWTQTGSSSNVLDLLIANNKVYAAVYDMGILSSSDKGLTWVQSNSGVSNISLVSLCYTGSAIFAGGFNGNIFKSTDNGATWTALNTGMQSLKVSKLAYNPAGVFASLFSKGIYFSNDNGANWTALNNGLTDLFVNSIAVSGTNIFAGTNNSGVFISANNGTKWSNISSGLTDLSVNHVVVIGTDLYVCTSNGLWKRSITEILSGVEEKFSIPTSALLQQNYPNPFNPTTTIKYSIPVETGYIPSLQLVTLKVFDLLGKEVTTLVNEEKSVGNYEVKFNSETLHATSLPSGIYFYKLSVGNFSQTKKMILMK